MTICSVSEHLHRLDGVHHWSDQYGNHGTELVTHHEIAARMIQTPGLFGPSSMGEGGACELAKYFDAGSKVRRSLCVIIDGKLPQERRDEITRYFEHYESKGVIEGHINVVMTVNDGEKNFKAVSKIILAAKKVGLKRRDLFVAIGSQPLADLVGFAAGTYRRSTPWILISTDILGTVRSSLSTNSLSIDYTAETGVRHNQLLSFVHPPLVGFYDPRDVCSVEPGDMRRGMAELIRLGVLENGELLSYIEANAAAIVPSADDDGAAGHELVQAVEMAIDTLARRKYPVDMAEKHIKILSLGLGSETVSVLQQLLDSHDEDAEFMITGAAFMAALSVVKGSLKHGDLKRYIDVMVKLRFRVFHHGMQSPSFWSVFVEETRDRGSSLVIPAGGGGTYDFLSLSEVLVHDVQDAVYLLQCFCLFSSANSNSAARSVGFTTPIITTRPKLREQRAATRISYHVATTPNLFDANNPTLIQSYCVDKEYTSCPGAPKKRALIVVDRNIGEAALAKTRAYFKAHAASLDDFTFHEVNVSSVAKDMKATFEIVEAAINFGISPNDVFIVIGGGTIMDVIGFVAAMFKNGVPYVRIATTLVGMIDAGIGAKVGVNFHHHKNLVGRYYAPLACLNDPAAFLPTLPKRDFACGLAEAVKMALIKSPRLFEVVEKYHGTLTQNEHTPEVLQIAIQTMLEELQPNLHETSLVRLVDFGHEFGHIIESLAQYELPHGECVSIGMSISSHLAHVKGRLSYVELEEILDCLLSLGLPVYTTEHDCCSGRTLWAKISTEGIEHKDGKLLLAIPEKIGTGAFIDEIIDISADMVEKTMDFLQEYQGAHGGAAATTNGSVQLMDQVVTVIGASGNIGASLVQQLVQIGLGVKSMVRPESVDKLLQRLDGSLETHSVIAGDFMDLVNLEKTIGESTVIFNTAGVVTLKSRPEDYAKVIAVNGFAQGVIAHLARRMHKDKDLKVIFPSTQRVHIIEKNADATAWIRNAKSAFERCCASCLGAANVLAALELFSQTLLVLCPVPQGVNVYELSKLLGESFVADMPRGVSLRISGVYGPGFTGGFVHRALSPKSQHSVEAVAEKRDFIFVDDLIDILLKMIASPVDESARREFDVASGESVDLEHLWNMAREILGDDATVTFTESAADDVFVLDTTTAEKLLARPFTTLQAGLQKTMSSLLGSSTSESSSALGSPWNMATRSSSASTPGEPVSPPRGLAPVLNSIVFDVGSTTLRIAVLSLDGLPLGTPVRVPSPSRQSHPDLPTEMLQKKLLEEIAARVDSAKAEYPDDALEEVGISLGAVVDRAGIVQDASILWGEPACGYNLLQALKMQIPGMRFTILNDISAAAWRYHTEGRFCLITVSSGLSNKVMNLDLQNPDRLDTGPQGIGGEMGHVVVEPQATNLLIQRAMERQQLQYSRFKSSVLPILSHGSMAKVTHHVLRQALQEEDPLALELARAGNIPVCPCGNVGDLCSLSSGRAALKYAQSLASEGTYSGVPREIDDAWLQEAIASKHALGVKTLNHVTYPVALRIVQLAADIGLDKFIIVGGFVTKTAKNAYIPALQSHLLQLIHKSAYFSHWTEEKVRSMVKAGVDDDNDSLYGAGQYIQSQKTDYLAVEKVVGQPKLVTTQRKMLQCGAKEFVVKIVFSGICTTDMQIVDGTRGLEPGVLGHEGICQVMQVGKDVKGVEIGEMIVLNPNNPLDDHSKLGHNFDGVFQEYLKIGQESIQRRQILSLGRSVVPPVYTLIEPLSCVVAAQCRIRDGVVGKNVVVIGAGMMGLMFVLMNQKMGARNVFLANRSRSRLDFATSRGIVAEEATFVMDHAAFSPASKISRVGGADVIIIAVSSGQGRAATELAMEQINSGGCIYLFAGFQPGDTITTDDADQNVDAWAIRTDWKHEQVSVRGKPLTLSGHRGSRVHDLEQASDQIRQHELAFSKLLSHVISLDALPDAMQSLLLSNSEIRGRVPRRVVIDHAAPRQTLEPYEETPLRHLYEATRKPKKDISKGNIFRDIGFDGERSMLGWVLPPPWAAVRKEIQAVVDLGFVDSAEFFIWVGTGSWSFALEALQHVVVPRSTGATTFLVLNSLDPAALAGVLRRIEGRLSRVVCVGISQSGSTLETTMLMDTLRGCFEQAKLDHHEHFLWLTDIGGPSKIHVTGEVTIRSSTTTTHDWSKTHMVPLTVNNHADINALFCSPHSMATLLPLFILLGKDWKRMQTVFEQYVSLRPHIAEKVLQDTQSVAFALFETTWAVFDKDLGSAADKLAIQLVEQGLGSKRSDFNPRLEVSTTPATRAGSDAATTLDFSRMPGSTHPAAKLMLTMYGLSIFVAAMAYHRGINFVTHPKVDFYKRRAKQLAHAKNAVSIQSTVDDVCAATVAYVKQAHPKLRRVNLLYYCHEWFYDGSAILDALIRQLHKSGLEDIPIFLAQGEEWNHSRFQAAMQDEDALHVVVGFEYGAFPAVPGVSDEAMRANFHMLQSIARATHEVLCPRSLYFKLLM